MDYRKKEFQSNNSISDSVIATKCIKLFFKIFWILFQPDITKCFQCISKAKSGLDTFLFYTCDRAKTSFFDVVHLRSFTWPCRCPIDLQPKTSILFDSCHDRRPAGSHCISHCTLCCLVAMLAGEFGTSFVGRSGEKSEGWVLFISLCFFCKLIY